MSKPSSAKSSLRERIESILASKKLTLHQVSQLSESLYGRAAEYFIPHNFYYELGRGTFTPSIYQIAALSRISGYRLEHWLCIFGFELEEIARLQVSLSAKRTVLLNSALVDPANMVHGLRNRPGQAQIPEIAPLSQLLEVEESPMRAGSRQNDDHFLYAKVGIEDDLAFPDLLPGSIVRVNPELGTKLLPPADGATSRCMFLLEHSKGLFCCRIRAVRNAWIPISTKLPYGQVEVDRSANARILGAIDLEIRPLVKAMLAEVPIDLAKRWQPRPLQRPSRFSHLVRDARARMKLSLHAASALSRRIAELLSDSRYFISTSSLSDYEIAELPPRHFHKVITLCVLYGLEFRGLLQAIGISPGQTGTQAIPGKLMGRDVLSVAAAHGNTFGRNSEVGLLEELRKRIRTLPVFLLRSVRDLSGLADPGLEDFFWLGGEKNVFHPHLTDALIAIVNRRKKKPIHYRSKPLWEQPIYLLLLREGQYLCACCSLEDSHLVVHPYPQDSHRPLQFRHPDEAEVVGQIVTIARKLL